MKKMKLQCFLLGCLFLLNLTEALAQVPAGAVMSSTTRFPGQINQESGANLTKFDLDFAGGTPKALVAAIQKTSGKPLNVIIPEEYADTKLPALKMKNVNVYQLFQALSAASQKTEQVSAPGYGIGATTAHITGYGFRVTQGPVSDETIWNFYVDSPKPKAPEQPRPPAKLCRFYSLAPYLEKGTTVDDITTAIKTAAKMLGEGTEPEMSFHKDTKLLIAVGESGKLEIIDSALRALDTQRPVERYEDRLKAIIQKATPEPAPDKK